jgi:REP element-mobilizing transposase RayT
MHGLPVRRSIRLMGFDYRDAGAYFVTICTFRRACVLADVVDDRVSLTAVGSVVESAWRTIPGYFPHFGLEGYVVMPNHLHGILVLQDAHRAKHPPKADASPLQPPRSKGTQPGSVQAVIQTFKAISTRRFHALPGMKLNRLWQRGFYDHVIRDEAELNRIRAYVEENPLRWALDRENLSGPFV